MNGKGLALTVLLAAYTASNTLTYMAAKRRAFTAKAPPKPPKTATVAVTVWNEPQALVVQCLNSIRSQTSLASYPEMFEVIVVDGPGAEHAYPYADKVFHAQRGKLNARHLAFQAAKGEVVVFVDADVILPPNSLHLILEPFRDPRVVAVTSTTDQGALEPFIHLPSYIVWAGKLTGRFCAVRRDAYFKAGGFNLNIPQDNLKALYHEEEFAFMRRLERVGKVVLRDVPVIHLGGRGRGLHRYRLAGK